MAKRKLWKGETPLQKIALAAILVGYGVYLLRKRSLTPEMSGARVSIDPDLAGDMVAATLFGGNPVAAALIKNGTKRVVQNLNTRFGVEAERL